MKTAINTRTQEEYDALMEWRKQTGQPYLGNGIWQTYQEDTCIDFDNGNWAAFSGIEWYKSNGYTIIPFTEFAKANLTESLNYEERYREAVELLDESRLQIEYLHGKFKATGTGINVLLKIDTFLTKHKDLTPSGE